MFGCIVNFVMLFKFVPCILTLWLCCSRFSNAELDWWESATLYQVYPRSFMDSDGDGIGDLNGITSRLDYLKEIGVTATWLSPILESPMADNGYDISNFTRIDPLFGTLDDFDAMIAKAHKLGLKIILDFVPNHSSDECEWFQKSLQRQDGYDDFYIWDDGKIDPVTGERKPPSNWISAFTGPMWTWREERQQYYLHQFSAKQPDLNFRNAMVRERMLDVLRFWVNRGADGFRIDAVPHLIEQRLDNGTYQDEPVSGFSDDPNSYTYLTHPYTREQPETPAVIYEWRELLDEYKKEHGGDTIVLIAEAYSPLDFVSNLISNGTKNGTQIPMNFQLMPVNQGSSARDVEYMANLWMDAIWQKHHVVNWVVGNHDQSRLATRVGQQKVDLMTMLIHSLPGTSVTYYGEEIGMSDVAAACVSGNCDDRDAERTPMQWDNSTNAGFSNGSTTWLKVSDDYALRNVEAENGVERSTLQIFKEMVKFKQSPAFRTFKEEGGYSLGAVSDQVFQCVRTAKGSEEYRVLMNLGNQTENISGLTNKTMKYVLLSSYSPHSYGEKIDLSKSISLMPYESVVLYWSANQF